jgi:hypothetical protein
VGGGDFVRKLVSTNFLFYLRISNQVISTVLVSWVQYNLVDENTSVWFLSAACFSGNLEACRSFHT